MGLEKKNKCALKWCCNHNCLGKGALKRRGQVSFQCQNNCFKEYFVKYQKRYGFLYKTEWYSSLHLPSRNYCETKGHKLHKGQLWDHLICLPNIAPRRRKITSCIIVPWKMYPPNFILSHQYLKGTAVKKCLEKSHEKNSHCKIIYFVTVNVKSFTNKKGNAKSRLRLKKMVNFMRK